MSEDTPNRIKKRNPLFPGSIEIRQNTKEAVSPVNGTKTARNFGFDLYHAEIPFGLIIIQRNSKVLRV